MKFGICCAPGALGEPARLLETLEKAGADYAEWAVGSVMASESELERLQKAVSRSRLKPEVFCVFLPPHHRVTGPDVQLEKVLEYGAEAARRCALLGGEIIVFGSAAARKTPDGFSPQIARAQFEEFCRELGPRVAPHGITMTIEPLNTAEDNLVNSVSEGARIVEAVNHPNIQLLADFYHMFMENESVQNVVDAGDKIRHTHLADLNRVAPGFAKDGEADFPAFFGALKKIGYNARCSFEGKTEDFSAQAPKIIAHMKRRWETG